MLLSLLASVIPPVLVSVVAPSSSSSPQHRLLSWSSASIHASPLPPLVPVSPSHVIFIRPFHLVFLPPSNARLLFRLCLQCLSVVSRYPREFILDGPAIFLIYVWSWTLLNGPWHCIVPACVQRVLAFDIVLLRTCLALALIHELIGSFAGRVVKGTVLHGAVVIWWRCVYHQALIHAFLFVWSNLLLMTGAV